MGTMRYILSGCIICCLLISCEDIVSVPDISGDTVRIIAPVNDAILTEGDITFSWEALELADEYQLQIVTPSFTEANQVVLDTIVGDSIQSVRNITATLPPESYQWRIRAINSEFVTAYSSSRFTVEAIVEEGDLSNEIVEVLAPANNIEIVEGVINFNWETINSALQYRFQIAHPDFENAVQFVTDTLISNSNFSTQLNSDLYEWRVQAINETSQTSYTTQSIIILDEGIAFSNQTVTLIAPEDNFETSETAITLSWEPLEEANLYRIQVINTADNTVFREESTTDQEITIDFDLGAYEWSVRGENETQNTPYTTRGITILEEDIELFDQTVTLIAPEDNFETSETAITLSWEPLEEANLYRIQVINTVDNTVFTEESTTDQEITIDFVTGTYEWAVRGENETQNTPYVTRTITIL